MKIQAVSDLHIEKRPDQQKFKWVHPDADLIIIAGDASDSRSFDRLAAMLSRPQFQGKEVIYLLGNHEHYLSSNVGDALGLAGRALEGVNEGRVRVTYQETLKTSLWPSQGPSVRFICATLWSDISRPMDRLSARGLNDFRVPGLTVDWYIEEHRKHVAFIESELGAAQAAGERAVVVTHHCPSFNSTPPRFRTSSLKACFTTELSHLMYGPEAPVLWIHGHTHDAFDYVLGNTRVVCNPYGYPGEDRCVDRGFSKDLLIEL